LRHEDLTGLSITKKAPRLQVVGRPRDLRYAHRKKRTAGAEVLMRVAT
jgi:hypothetical protein